MESDEDPELAESELPLVVAESLLQEEKEKTAEAITNVNKPCFINLFSYLHKYCATRQCMVRIWKIIQPDYERLTQIDGYATADG